MCSMRSSGGIGSGCGGFFIPRFIGRRRWRSNCTAPPPSSPAFRRIRRRLLRPITSWRTGGSFAGSIRPADALPCQPRPIRRGRGQSSSQPPLLMDVAGVIGAQAISFIWVSPPPGMRPTGVEPATFGLKDRRSLGPRKDPLTTELRALGENDTRARGSERCRRG